MTDITPAARYDSTVSCGLPTEVNVEPAEVLPLPKSLVGNGTFFILTAKGDSMTGIGVDDGDLVIVREQNACKDGDYAVVLVDGRETLLKTVTYLPDKQAYLLHAENPDYPDREEHNVTIQGVAIKVIKSL
jgi:repressor LexA